MLPLEENAARHSSHLHVLRELVRRSCAHIALTPRLETKLTLADHVYDDARAVAKLRRRVEELRPASEEPGEPSPELVGLLGDTGRGDYLQVAYGVVKPALLAALRAHAAAVDPVLDEPSLRLLTQIAHRQERHVEELVPSDLPAAEAPGRDPYVDAPDPALDAALRALERAARASHENPDRPWDFHLDRAREAWDHARHAAALDRALTERGTPWGTRGSGGALLDPTSEAYVRADAERHARERS